MKKNIALLKHNFVKKLFAYSAITFERSNISFSDLNNECLTNNQKIVFPREKKKVNIHWHNRRPEGKKMF